MCGHAFYIFYCLMNTPQSKRFFGDPPEIRTPDPLLKRQSPDSQGWGEPKTCCCSSTFRSSVFCVYVTRPTAYPVFYYNHKNCVRQTFLSINRYIILEINHSKTIFKKNNNMFSKTLLSETNIFLTTAEVLPRGTLGQPPPDRKTSLFWLVFSLPFSDNQSFENDRPAKKYYIIKAQRERNPTPQNKKLFSKNATQPKQESNPKVRTNQHLSNKRRTKNENQFCCKDH